MLLLVLQLLSTVQASGVGVARMYSTENQAALPSNSPSTVTISECNDSNVCMVQWDFTGMSNSAFTLNLHEFGDISDPSGAANGDVMISITELDVVDGVSAGTAYSSIDLSGDNSVLGRAFVVHDNVGRRLAHGVTGSGNAPDNTISGPPLHEDSVLVAGMRGTLGYEAITGTVELSRDNTGVMTAVILMTGATEGTKHGFHIHEYGDSSDAFGDMTGNHYDVDGSLHGLPTDEEHHRGDMGNVVSTSDGTVEDTLLLEGYDSIDDLIGLGIVLHAELDQGIGAQPSGDAGARIAVGVIGLQGKETTTTSAVTPSPEPATESDALHWTMMVIAGVFVVVLCSVFFIMYKRHYAKPEQLNERTSYMPPSYQPIDDTAYERSGSIRV